MKTRTMTMFSSIGRLHLLGKQCSTCLHARFEDEDLDLSACTRRTAAPTAPVDGPEPHLMAAKHFTSSIFTTHGYDQNDLTRFKVTNLIPARPATAQRLARRPRAAVYKLNAISQNVP